MRKKKVVLHLHGAGYQDQSTLEDDACINLYTRLFLDVNHI